MVGLTNLAGKEIWVNFDLVKYIESTPDTILCFLDGSRLPVKEKPEAIVEKYNQQKQKNFSIKQQA